MILSATALSSYSAANSAVVRVDKATSEFLSAPDWTINIDICDAVNANPWLAKDVVKALKKRLQHKNPSVQLLSLTLLETMIKNSGDNVHFQIAERNILPEMIKIVKKKTDMRVREKILVLLDSWQEAFGGRGGKYPQYYFVYDELRQYGVQFPQRSPDAPPIFTPPVTYPSLRPPQANYGMPINSSTRLDEAMASEIKNLSVNMIESMRNVSDLLSEMLQEVDTNDHAAVKDEVIVDVVERCRSNQKKLMQMLASTSDEELLGQGIELNDNLQTVLAKHDAITSGFPILVQITSSIAPPPPSSTTGTPKSQTKPTEEYLKTSDPVSVSPPSSKSNNKPEEEEEDDEDDFALLARRHSKAQTQTGMSQNGGVPDPSMSMALTLTDPPLPVNTTTADDMIDFLRLTLSSSVNTTSPPVTSPQYIDQSPPPVSATVLQTQPQLNSYVVPWAQSEPQQAQYQQQQNYSSGYIPPPWAATPGYYTNNNNSYASASASASSSSSSVPYTYAHPSYNSVPTQQVNSYLNNNNMWAPGVNGDGQGQGPFIPSYRLFEDLNVLGNPKTGGTGASSGQSMMSGKK